MRDSISLSWSSFWFPQQYFHVHQELLESSAQEHSNQRHPNGAVFSDGQLMMHPVECFPVVHIVVFRTHKSMMVSQTVFSSLYNHETNYGSCHFLLFNHCLNVDKNGLRLLAREHYAVESFQDFECLFRLISTNNKAVIIERKWSNGDLDQPQRIWGMSTCASLNDR